MPQFRINAKTETYFDLVITADSAKAARKKARKMTPEDFTGGGVGTGYDMWVIENDVERVPNEVDVTVTITEEVLFEIHKTVDLDKETLEAARERIVDEWLGDEEKMRSLAAVTERSSRIELTDDET